MDVIDALHARSTVPAYKPDPVRKDTILKILKAATRAPSWANTQPWEIFVAGGEPLERLRTAYVGRYQERVPPNPDLSAPQTWPPVIRQRMAELMSARARLKRTDRERDGAAVRQSLFESNYRFFGAPAVVFLCMDRNLSSWSLFDMGLLAQSIMLAAQEYQVDSAPAFLFGSYPDLVRAELDIPTELSILIGLALGYADMNPQNQYRSVRRSIEDVVHCKSL
ncbi:MAG: nitroreductase [Halobacteriota archaeon]